MIITAKRAAEICREWYVAFRYMGKGEEKCILELLDVVDTIEALEAAQPKWISVEDRLPEAYDDGSVDAVLVTDGSFIHMAYFSCGKWRFCESGEMKEEMFYAVTHWMPIPQMPKEDA